jgi:protoporphyrinogen oxidase
MFRFPLRGGTGEIWKRLAASLPTRNLATGKALASLDARGRSIRFTDGTTEDFDILISTMPVDDLVHLSDLEDLKPAAAKLRRSATHVIGIGLKGAPGVHLKKKCWMYFPEENVPFYRVTVFSNYSPNNVPDSSRFWSLMAEVSESPKKPVGCAHVVEQTIAGMVTAGLIEKAADVVSTWHYRAGHGYPTPSLGRNEAINAMLPDLERYGVFSRGRFGAWKYEVSNQDHSLMQGVELINRLAYGSEEITLNRPAEANSRRTSAAAGAK